MKTLVFAALSASLLCMPVLAHGNKKCASCPQNSATKTTLAKGDKQAILSAKMHCGGCAQGIQQMLGKQPGVKSVKADPKTKLVTVTYASAKQSPSKLASTLTKAGFAAKEVKASAKTNGAKACEMCPGEKGAKTCEMDGDKA